MPWPKEISNQQGKFNIDKDFAINLNAPNSERLTIATTKFLRRLDGRTGIFFKNGFALINHPNSTVQINVKSIAKLDLQQDESYQLTIAPNQIIINANTDSGAIYGLETLLQTLQNTNDSFYFPTLSIQDSPRFRWRGLMIDAARHFMPVDVIKRNLDAMAAVKLNVFHWHLVDDQGWRIEMKSLKQLHLKASDGLYYTQEQIKDVVQYAGNLGIMVVPEIDVPGHASAILTAIPEIGSTPNKKYSLERNAGVFNPTLDPTNPKTYQIINQIFDEVCPLFPGKYFHIGGDENEGKEWDANPKIQKFKKENNLATNHDLQTYFTMKLIPILKKHNKLLMGWEEIMTKDMSKDAIIHAWRGPNEGLKAGESLANAAKNGYQTVLSNGYYLDLVLGIDTYYNTDPINKELNLSSEIQKNILGGEATIWAELVTPLTIDSRIWPRTAAIAERLWSDSSVNNLKNMKKRLIPVTDRLEELGITHIRNKGVILRNIANYQDIQALEKFSNICEPLKLYTRNKGGTEYQMYSPLTLFADACTPDASDAEEFNSLVELYNANHANNEAKSKIINQLQSWISTHKELVQLQKNAPIISGFLPLSKNLNDLSQQLINKLQDKSYDAELAKKMLENCKSKDYADVELAIIPGLVGLIQ
ncbi:MAG: family 20 glycosylhydrolase [Bacteroidetes bacterium]|nr:family 20 glycosylhydrolase [Bacteroidota bacterium]